MPTLKSKRISASRAPVLTANALTVLEARYFLRDAEGKPCETAPQLFERVAKAIASREVRARAKWEDRFLEMLCSLRFLPNSPTLMNAGKKRGQLSACFVLPIADSLGGIFDTLKQAALIHQSGGGTGFSFSALRPKGSRVQSTHGAASGPVSYIKIFDAATETIKQGGTRRGANMAILRADHPDIEEFVDVKRDLKSIMNFNVSVGATDEFMSAARSGAAYGLRDPQTGKMIREISAAELFDKICLAAWECGDPGLVFFDRVNRFNPTPKAGPMESTNPCGEQPLLPHESCNLGSLNLNAYMVPGSTPAIDWKLLREDVYAAVRFLDNVIDENHFPVAECAKITRKNRKIGLGVMGFADLLLSMDVPYDSDQAVALGARLMAFVDREAKRASAVLAKERGAFPNFKGSLWERLGYPKLRNATVSTVAPTGTISIIAGCSSGIEPIFSGVFYRNVLSGGRLLDVHPAVSRALKAKNLSIGKLTDEKIAEALGQSWRPAPVISVEAHVRMQAAFQRSSDSAVSKTINLSADATREDVKRAYWLAYDSGCKGITVFRDTSRGAQVLERPSPNDPECVVC